MSSTAFRRAVLQLQRMGEQPFRLSASESDFVEMGHVLVVTDRLAPETVEGLSPGGHLAAEGWVGVSEPWRPGP